MDSVVRVRRSATKRRLNNKTAANITDNPAYDELPMWHCSKPHEFFRCRGKISIVISERQVRGMLERPVGRIRCHGLRTAAALRMQTKRIISTAAYMSSIRKRKRLIRLRAVITATREIHSSIQTSPGLRWSHSRTLSLRRSHRKTIQQAVKESDEKKADEGKNGE